MTMLTMNTTAQNLLEQYQAAYTEQIGRRMIIGSEEYTLSAIFSYVQAVYAEMLNASYNNRFLETANGVFLDEIAKQYNLDRTPAVFGNPYFEGYFLWNDPDGRTYGAGEYEIEVGGHTYTNAKELTVDAGNEPMRWICEESTVEPMTKEQLYNAIVGEGKPFSEAGVLSDGIQSVPEPIEDDEVFRAYIQKNKRLYVPGIAESFESVALLTSEFIVDAHCIRQNENGFVPGEVTILLKSNDIIPGLTLITMFGIDAIKQAIDELNLLTVGQSLEVRLLGLEMKSISGITAYIDPVYADSGQGLVNIKCKAVKAWMNNHLRISDPIYPGAIIDMLKTPLNKYSNDRDDFNLTESEWKQLGDFCVIDAKSANLNRITASEGFSLYINEIIVTAVLN